MASDWVTGLFTLAGTALGSGGTAWITRGGRQHEQRMAREARRDAHETWHRDNRSAAYVEFLVIAEKISNVLGAAYPMVDTNPPAPLPPLPTLEEQADAAARLTAFGTPQVIDAHRTWDGIVRSALRQVEVVSVDPAAARERQRLHELRDEEQAARAVLYKAIREDLAPAS